MFYQLIKVAICTCLLIYSASSMAQFNQTSKVIYGQDSRLDPQDSMNNFHVELSRSTAAQIAQYNFKVLDELGLIELRERTLQQAMNVCPSERFSQQNANAHCSAFLVGQDLMATAGHCIDQQACQNDEYAFVFDYRSDMLIDNKLSLDGVYYCDEVVVHEFEATALSDYALFRLDRPVHDRAPLEFRTEGSVDEGDELIVIGHPSGVPTKIASGSTVQKNDNDQFFVADLDTYGGNSGSAVLSAQTGVVEGILVRGARDYVPNFTQGCFVSNYCEDLGGAGCGGESVSRITKLNISEFL